MRFTFYTGRNNWEVIGLAESGQPLTTDQVNAITRARLELADGRAVDSQDSGAVFDIGMAGVFGTTAVVGVGINPAAALGVMPPTRARLITFDGTHPEGYVWPGEFELEVKA